MNLCKKIWRNFKYIEPNTIDGCPSCYLHSAQSMLSEPRGSNKLRVRNETIQADLADYASKAGTRIHVQKQGNQTLITVLKTGIIVCLYNG